MENKVKKCKYCGTEMDESAKICPNCKKRQSVSVVKIVLIVLLVLVIIGVIGGSGNDENKAENDNSSENPSTQTAQNVTNNSEEKYTLGDTFVFDDLEITLGNECSFVTLENQFSEHNNADVVRIPITVKNLKDTTHSLNMFYIKVFGSQGTELDDVSSYFSEDCVEFGGELRSGSSYTKYLYFLYDGDGEYEVAFDNFATQIKVDFNITK